MKQKEIKFKKMFYCRFTVNFLSNLWNRIFIIKIIINFNFFFIFIQTIVKIDITFYKFTVNQPIFDGRLHEKAPKEFLNIYAK
jgi:hypothetical protein